MGYEDRDYFQSKPRFELSPGVNPATKVTMIAIVACYLIALIVGNQTNFASAEFLASANAGGPLWVLRLVVLTPMDTNSWASGFSPGYWKILTHWLVPASLFGCLMDAIGVYFVGRMVEELFGTRRFVLLFVAACVLSGLMATFTDPLILGNRTGVVMGPVGGAVAMFLSVAWIAPHQRTFFGWQLRPVVFGLIGVFVVLNIVTGLVGSEAVVRSPTQLLWGAVFSAVYMSVLKARGKVPSPAPGSFQEAWNKRGNLPENVDPVLRSLAEARKQEEKDRAEAEKRRQAEGADQQRLDAILEKISKQGISSLSRGEKSFLDAQSKRRKP